MKRASWLIGMAAWMCFLNSHVFARFYEKDAELEQAKKYFNNGQFQQAIDLLEDLTSTEMLTEANEYLAVAYVSTGKDEQAKEVFAGMLKKQPDYKPSEFWWPHNHLMKVFYQTAKEMQGSLEVERPDPGIQTIAIMDFENNAIDDAEKYVNLGNALSKILISDFAVLSDLRVVERERIQFLIDELELTEKQVGGKNIVDLSTAPRLGKLLGAHSFVFGSFIKLGDTFRMDVRLVKTETGEIFKTASVEGKPDKIFELAKKLTMKITEDLDVDIQKVEREKLDEMGRDTIPIEAVALFGDAMSKANEEDYQDAYVKLEEALALAPNFQKAQDMITAIRPLTL